MGSEFTYSLETYPVLYTLWAAVAASWLLAVVGLAMRLARARPVIRFDRPVARIVAALRDATVQRPIWRRPLAGAMHLSIMAGAVLVLATFLVTHYVAPRGPEWNRSRLAHALVDAALLLTLLGLAVAAWRRHVRRGERSVNPTPRVIAAAPPARVEDVALWTLLLIGALAALLSEALLITLALPAWRRSAFFSNPLAGLLDGLSPLLRRGLYGWAWSLLHAALLGTAFLLPWTKWRHVALAPIALLTRKAEPLARLDPIDLETDGPFGALRPRDLTWKERLDLAACVHCGRCTQACPAAVASGGTDGLDPRRLIEALDAVRTSGPLATVGATGRSLLLWQCTTCMACDDACPIGISPLSLVIDLRRERVLDAASFPHPLRDVFDGLSRRGNPWGLARAERDDWLASLDGDGPAGDGAGLSIPNTVAAPTCPSDASPRRRGRRRSDLPILAPGGETDVLLWLGCMGGYDPRVREAVVALARLLRGAGIEVATLGPDEGCCGDPARRAGNEALWHDLAEANLAALATRRFRRIVTLCPHCANTLANEQGRPAGGHYKADLPVSHAAPYLADLLREGRLAPAAVAATGMGDDRTPKERPLRVTFHDPCYLARGMGDTASARTLLAAMPNVDVIELPHHGRDTLCCGAGGGRMWLEGTDGTRLGEPRLDDIAAAGVDLCVTACPYCRTMIADGAADAAANAADGAFPAVCDLVELLAGARPGRVMAESSAIQHAPALAAARGEE